MLTYPELFYVIIFVYFILGLNVIKLFENFNHQINKRMTVRKSHKNDLKLISDIFKKALGMTHKRDHADYILENISNNLTYWKTNFNQDQSILMQFKDEASNIEELMSQTLTLGESNSLLIIGPHGCGKSAIINAIINKLKSDQILNSEIVVHLNGLLETNDRLALQAITRQLHLNEDEALKFGTFAENLNFILKTFQCGSRDSSKPIVFILDEFDLFCHHQNQTLLYNLFDIAQSAQAPICVVGLTARLDVIELLEKRVKSRFSHRQIYLYPRGDFEQYLQIAKESLKADQKNFKKTSCVAAWNKNVDEIFEMPDVVDVLKQIFRKSKDIRNLKSFLFLVTAAEGQERSGAPPPRLTPKHFKDAASRLSQDCKQKIVEDLSILQLSLLIAMKQIYEKYDGEPFNFEMVYRQYTKFGQRHSSMRFDRAVIFKAFNELESLELLQPVERSRTTIQPEYRLMNLLLMPYQIQEIIQTLPNLPTFLIHWCTSFI